MIVAACHLSKVKNFLCHALHLDAVLPFSLHTVNTVISTHQQNVSLQTYYSSTPVTLLMWVTPHLEEYTHQQGSPGHQYSLKEQATAAKFFRWCFS